MADKQTRKQQQEQARQDRLRVQQAAAARDSRLRRLQILVGTVLAAAVIVGLGFAFFSGEDRAERTVGGDVSTTKSGVKGVRETRALLDGLPQKGFTLGREDAPVTLYAYIDFQCPFCAQHELKATPSVVRQLVRPGRVRLVTMPLDNLGDDSIRAAGVSQSMARKNRFYDYAHLYFYNQGDENTGYATDGFLRNLVAQVPGGTPSDVTPDISTELRELFATNQKQFSDAGATGTPAFEVGRTGGPRQKFEATNDVFTAELTKKVAELEKQGG